MLGVVFVGLVAIVGRLTQVQALSASGYAQKGSVQRVRHITLAAERGSVFDRNGVDLALSVAQQTVWANPRVVGSKAAEYTAKLAPVLGADAKALEARLSKERPGADGKPERPAFVYLARKVDEATADAVRKLDLPGVDFVPDRSGSTRRARWRRRCSATSVSTTRASPAWMSPTRARSPASPASSWWSRPPVGSASPRRPAASAPPCGART